MVLVGISTEQADGDNVRSEASPTDLGLSALGRGHATFSRPVARLRPSAAILFFFLSAFCWCSFAGTLPPSGFPAHPRSGFSVWQNGGCHSEGVGVEERSVGDGCSEVWSIGVRIQDSLVELLLEELVGWSSWFRAVMHERWMRPLVWTALPFRAEPMCEAERTHQHHPAPER